MLSFVVMTVVGCASSRPRVEPASPAVPSESVVEIGKSVQGRAIHMHVFEGSGEPALVFGGFHGNEPTSVDLANALLAYLRTTPGAAAGRRVAVVPAVNPDGLAGRQRTNTNGVDLNRNFPASNWSRRASGGRTFGGTSAASEPETKAVMTAVETIRPARILSIHSIARGRHCNNYDGPAAEIARAMAAANGYAVRATMGYATPGSFGTWAGVNWRIPTVTLELPRDLPGGQCWPDNRGAVLAFLNYGRPAGAASPSADRR
jgi:protein MpaA